MEHANFIQEKNREYAASFDKGHLPIPPSKKLLIVTCMDARVDPAASLGLELGDAHVVRNAGGVVKEAIRNIVISQRLLGTRSIAVFHHTDCGMLTFSTGQLRDIVKQQDSSHQVAEAVDKIDFLEFDNLEESVKRDVQFLKDHPLVLKETVVTGWVYNVTDGKVTRLV